MATSLEANINVNSNVGNTVNQFKELKNQLKEAIGALAGLEEGTAEYTAQAARVGQLRDQVSGLNDAIRNVSGAPVENLTGSFGLLSQQVGTLDFGGAATSLQQFSGQISSFSFKDLIAGANQFIGTLGTLGKALLQNPLFLAAGIITGIGAALFSLKDKIGFIGKAFDSVGKAVDEITTDFKKLSDAIFGTQIIAQEKTAKIIEGLEKEEIALGKRYNKEIELAKAAGKDIAGLEQKKIEDNISNNQKIIDGYANLQKQGAKLTEDQKKQLQAANDNLDEALFQRNLIGAKADGKYEENQGKAYDVANQVALEQFKEGVERDLEVEKRRQEAELKGLKTTEAFGRNRQAILAANEQKLQDIRDKYSKADSEKRNTDNKRLLRQIRDEEINAIQDETKRAEEKAKEDKKRRDEDNAESKASRDVKNAAIVASELQLNTDLAAIQKAKEEKDKANALSIQSGLDKNFQDRFDKENKDIIAAAELKVAQNQNDLTAQIDLLTAQKDLELQNEELTANERLLIQQNYYNAVNKLRIDDAEKQRQANLKKANDDLAIAGNINGALTSLSQAYFSFKSAGLKKGSKEEEENAKKQFKIQKALQLTGAIIDGAKAVVTSLASSPLAIGPIPNPVGIASLAAVVAASVANIAKIASTQYNGANTSTSGDSGGGGGLGGGAVSTGTTSDGLSISQFNAETVGDSGTSDGKGKRTGTGDSQRVYVLEADITNTQNRVKTIQSQATIG